MRRNDAFQAITPEVEEHILAQLKWMERQRVVVAERTFTGPVRRLEPKRPPGVHRDTAIGAEAQITDKAPVDPAERSRLRMYGWGTLDSIGGCNT